jgi:Domain of unknown function (DUF6883)
MPIPNAVAAYVPPEKLRDYLLDEQHPVGGSKAKWFRSLGYDAADPATLERALLNVVQVSDRITMKSSAFGTKYVIAGEITAPNGTTASVTTVWIVEPTNSRPRLVTAYPGDKP